MKSPLFLVDVSSIFYRAYYALPHMTNKEGFPTNALYGFLGMTLKLLQDFKPQYIVYCFDRPEPSFRKDLDPSYKANRSEMPEDLQVQIPYIKEFTDLFGIPRLDLKGYEADDIIGSYAKWAEHQEQEVVIISGDKDFAQLISEKVKMIDTMKKATYNPLEVEKKWGVNPKYFIDYLALLGDSSDNIPGVKGIGPKTAQKLINTYKSLDAIYENIDSIKGGVQKKLIDSKKSAYLSQTLVTIKTDLKLPTDKKDLLLSEMNVEKLGKLLLKLNFNKFARDLGVSFENEDSLEIKKSNEDKIKFIENAKEKDLNLIPKKSDVYIFSLENRFIFLHENLILCFEEVTPSLQEILKNKDFIWSGYDLKSLWQELGLSPTRYKDDLMIAAYSLKAGAINFQALYSDHIDPLVPDETQLKSLALSHRTLLQKIKGEMDKKTQSVYENIELPCISVLSKMEALGIRIDSEDLKEQSAALEEDLKTLEESIYELSDEVFNIKSPKQLGDILFEKLKIPSAKKSKRGYSTANDVLEKFKGEYPICGEVLKFRELAKLKSTYVDVFPQLMNPLTKRIHTTFKQAFTSTGRLSSVNPNLQNIPIRTERGSQVRKAFISDSGKTLISADYSQIELRILAHISGDSTLIQAYKKDRDIHAVTASQIFRVPLSQVTTDQRRKAKAVNFGIAYGQGAFGLSQSLGIFKNEAEDIIDRYFTQFYGVKAYMEDIVDFARKKGYVETLLGRRRHLPELQSNNRMIQSFAERAAINAPMQGTQADIVKLTMIRADKEISAPMILQIHDELIFECEESQVSNSIPQIIELMENIYPLDVPLVVNCKSGKNWLEAH